MISVTGLHMMTSMFFEAISMYISISVCLDYFLEAVYSPGETKMYMGSIDTIILYFLSQSLVVWIS